MTLRIYTNKDRIDIITSANIKMNDIIKQLEEGNLMLIETIYKTTFIINCINVNAIEIISTYTNSPPIS